MSQESPATSSGPAQLRWLIPIAGNFTKKAFRHHLDENSRQINVQLNCTLDHLCGAHNTQQPSLKIWPCPVVTRCKTARNKIKHWKWARADKLHYIHTQRTWRKRMLLRIRLRFFCARLENAEHWPCAPANAARNQNQRTKIWPLSGRVVSPAR